MLPDSGSILRGIHFWEVQFALMLSPGWFDPFVRKDVRNADNKAQLSLWNLNPILLTLTLEPEPKTVLQLQRFKNRNGPL